MTQLLGQLGVFSFPRAATQRSAPRAAPGGTYCTSTAALLLLRLLLLLLLCVLLLLLLHVLLSVLMYSCM